MIQVGTIKPNNSIRILGSSQNQVLMQELSDAKLEYTVQPKKRDVNLVDARGVKLFASSSTTSFKHPVILLVSVNDFDMFILGRKGVGVIGLALNQEDKYEKKIELGARLKVRTYSYGVLKIAGKKIFIIKSLTQIKSILNVF